MNKIPLVAGLLVLFLVGCSAQPAGPVAYSMPEDYQPAVYEIEGKVSPGMQTYVIEKELPSATNYDRFLAWQKAREAQDRYRMARHLYESENEKTFAEAEEDRIEEYCKETDFGRCNDITFTCEEDGCHRVTVSCDDDFFDPGLDDDEECRRFKVDVSPDVDDALTEKIEEEVTEGGKVGCSSCG